MEVKNILEVHAETGGAACSNAWVDAKAGQPLAGDNCSWCADS